METALRVFCKNYFFRDLFGTFKYESVKGYSILSMGHITDA